MTLKLTEEKKQTIGNIIASFPTEPLGPLFHRALETNKIVGLKRQRQNYTLKFNYQMKYAVNLFGGNLTLKILFRIQLSQHPT